MLNTSSSALLMRVDHLKLKKDEYIPFVNIDTGVVGHLSINHLVYRAQITKVNENGQLEYEAIT